MRTALEHAQTAAFRRRVESACRIVDEAMRVAPNVTVMWSGGKDSTAMTHLVCVELGCRVNVASEKDDLDFPGEESYVTQLAERWHLDLTLLRPEVSPLEWVRANGSTMRGDENVHSRGSELSRLCFYPVVEEHGRRFDLIFLGLRKDESRDRQRNRAVNGQLYRKKSGQWVCQPIVDWGGLDVLAYCVSRGIELLPMYQCIALMHRDEPWRLRKSWWLPTSYAHRGQVTWLRHYYPSLFYELAEMLPTIRSLS